MARLRIKQIAAECGVHVSTVSRILNGENPNRYAEATRRRILDYARRNEYYPDRIARAMKSEKSGVFGFVTSSYSAATSCVENAIAFPFLVGMSHRATAQGYHVGLIELDELEVHGRKGRLPPALKEKFFDGLVVHYGLSKTVHRLLLSLNVPVIWWDSGLFEPSCCLYRDERKIVTEILEELTRLGHRRIVYHLRIENFERTRSGIPVHFSYRQRYETYVAEMKHRRLPVTVISGAAADSLAATLRDSGITAVITNNIPNENLLLAACRTGRSIPEDLSIVACSLESRVSGKAIDYSGMKYDRYEAGERAVEMLAELLRNPDRPPASVRLSGTFHPGETLAKAPVRRPAARAKTAAR